MTMWRLIEDGALRFRIWDGEYVVYNALSGDTHLLDADAMEILLSLQREPADAPALARSLAERWQCEMNSDLVREIDGMLVDMHALSLVECG